MQATHAFGALLGLFCGIVELRTQPGFLELTFEAAVQP